MDIKLLGNLKFNDSGLIPAIVQDFSTREVLMMAWQNLEAVEQTFLTGEAVFYSRSRQEIWRKGATSGNIQKVVSFSVDCDKDTVLILVEPAGPACHTGLTSCFDTLKVKFDDE